MKGLTFSVTQYSVVSDFNMHKFACNTELTCIEDIETSLYKDGKYCLDTKSRCVNHKQTVSWNLSSRSFVSEVLISSYIWTYLFETYKILT